MVLLRLLGEQTDVASVSVRIGTENEISGLSSARWWRLVMDPRNGWWRNSGVVGPTRMDYAATMSTVHAVARYLGRIIGDPT